MNNSLRERREETWHLLVELGIPYGDVISRVADGHDCAEGTVKSDISRMETWVGELDVSYYTGVSRLRELRQQRRSLNQMILRARKDEDLSEERKIRKEIRENLKTDVRMSQRLGLTAEEPLSVDVTRGLDEKEEELLAEFCGIDGDGVDLEDMA